MMTGNRITDGVTVAVVAMGIVGMTIGTANASPVSIDFNVGAGATHSGGPDNAAGLQLPGQVGAWNAFTVVASTGGEQSFTTTEGPTFTLNPGGGGASFSVFDQTASALREDMIANNNKPSVSWELTGLVENGEYSLIFFQSNAGAYAGARTTIDGVGLGSTEATEKDYDFTGIVADGSGKISGTFDAPTAAWYTFTGLQFEQTGGGPAATPGTLIYGK